MLDTTRPTLIFIQPVGSAIQTADEIDGYVVTLVMFVIRAIWRSLKYAVVNPNIDKGL
jgi:hypothetical protein